MCFTKFNFEINNLSVVIPSDEIGAVDGNPVEHGRRGERSEGQDRRHGERGQRGAGA